MCYQPIQLGEVGINVYDDRHTINDYIDDYGVMRRSVSLQVPCGECLECLNQKSVEWSYRIMDEVSQHADNCFITLTYNINPVMLIKKDVQDFIKRLRFHLDGERRRKKLEPIYIRVFYCGEYGAKGKRPHYHLIVFGWKPNDMKFWQKDKSGAILYRSKELEELWTFGFSSVGSVSLWSAKYCAKYLQKLQDVPKEFVQPFVHMSKGIGKGAINPKCLETDKIYHQGRYIKVPRYYLNKLDAQGYDTTEVRAERYRRAHELEVSKEELERRKKRCQILLDNKVKR